MKKGEWQDFTPPERSRVYYWPNGEAEKYRDVSRIKVGESGNHYLSHAEGKTIVAPGWLRIELDIDEWTF